MNKSFIGNYFLFLLILFPSTLFCQGYNNIGQPLIEYFSPKEYKSSNSNWTIVQDKRGVMYFGNTSGILEFDGNTWQRIEVPNSSTVRSLTIDDKGIIYVCASSDFGYLEPDSIGQLKYKSLIDHLDPQYENSKEIWDVIANSKGVYFKTDDQIFRWNGKDFNVLNSVYSFRFYKIGDDVYARNHGTGLMKIDGDSVYLMPGGEYFSKTGVFDMLPYKDKDSNQTSVSGEKILVTTNYKGLFLHDGKNFFPFKTEVDSFFIRNQVYNACIGPDGNFAFATQRGGVVIMDRKGHLLKTINEESGLPTNIVYDVYYDRLGGLWLATANGIAHCEVPSPFSIIPGQGLLKDQVSSIMRFENTLYAVNDLGILYLNNGNSAFKLVNGSNKPGMGLLNTDGILLAATNGGVGIVNNNNLKEMLTTGSTNLITHSKFYSNRIYAGHREGLQIIQKQKYKNQFDIYSTGIDEQEISSIVEEADNSLWLLSTFGVLIHITDDLKKLSSEPNEKIKFNRFTTENGLPGNSRNIYDINGKMLLTADKGVFRFNLESKTFIHDSTFGKTFSDSTRTISIIEKSRNGDLWILSESKSQYEFGRAILEKNGRYTWQPIPEFNRLDLSTVATIYSDYDSTSDKEVLWFSTAEGIVKYDPDIYKNIEINYTTLIRKILVTSDSLIYGGREINFLNSKETILSFNKNDIRFEFSATSFDKPEATLYQYYLEGNDDDWSQWISVPSKGYTNLSSGDYIFRVRAKNVYGIIGTEDTYAFTVLAPWYFSWWAYFVYGLIFLGMLYLIRHFEIKRLNKKHTLQLELIEYGKLKELDQLKSQFFANISHEFRTPLTLILGQIDSVMSSAIETKEKGKLQVANRNARRLLTLINQLLDLSKLEAGSMELRTEQHNIVSFLKSLFYSFESLAETQKISLRFESELENIPVIFDPDKMEKVFYNLVSNSFKFTSAKGEIKVSITVRHAEFISASSTKWEIPKQVRDDTKDSAEIRVKDNGTGIPANRLPHIFDRFYQVDSSSTREHEGTGIGLALTKELVELHKGKITVNSKENEGTEFIINLPLGDLKIEKEQLVILPADKFPQNKDINYSESIEANLASGIRHPASEDKKEIILIVEDNSDVRAYIIEQIETDYNVIEASNGEEGLLKAQNEIPDLIITDVMMPKMDGYQFSKHIRSDERTGHIPIIMLTAKAALDDKIEGLETGVDVYLTKPFSAKELIVRVKNLIYQRQQLRKRFSQSTIIKPSEVSAVAVDQIFLEKTVKIIEKHFDDEKFGIEQLAEEVCMSVSQLNRKLNALVDQPAGQLIRSLRLQRAADLLKQNAGSVAEICYKVGFNDQAYFSRAFKKQFGCSPSDYKKESQSSL